MSSRKRKHPTNDDHAAQVQDLQNKLLVLRLPSQKPDFGSDLKQFSQLTAAEKDRSNNVFTFAVSTGSKAWIYLNGTHEQLKRVFFEGHCQHPLRFYNYEVIQCGRPMKLHAEISYIKQLNEGKQEEHLIDSLWHYINKTYQAINERELKSIEKGDLLEHVCRSPDKIQYLIKLSDKCGHVLSEEENMTFWTKLLEFASLDLQSNDSSKIALAKQLLIRKKDHYVEYEDWIFKFKSSCSNGTPKYIRNLHASKFTEKTLDRHLFQSAGQELTNEYYLDSLIMRVSEHSKRIILPSDWTSLHHANVRLQSARKQRIKEWCRKTKKLDEAEDEAEERIKAKQSTSQKIVCLELQQQLRDLLTELNPEWILPPNSSFRISRIYQNKYLHLLPMTVQVHVPTAVYSTDQRYQSEWVEITNKGSISWNHFYPYRKDGDMFKSSNKLLRPESNIKLARFMVAVWGDDKWNEQLRKIYSFLYTPDNSKPVLRLMPHSNGFEFETYTKQRFIELFQPYYAYSLKSVAQWNFNSTTDDGSPDGTLGDFQMEEEISEQMNKIQIKKAQEKLVSTSNPALVYFTSQQRRDFDGVEYRPCLLPKYVTPASSHVSISSGCSTPRKPFNTWTGYGVVPIYSEKPCPLLLGHIRRILVSNNQEHYNYLINYLAWLVQRPEQKSQVQLVLLSAQGTGKSTLAKVLLKIFGPHGIQLSHRRQFSNNFNGHLEGKNLVVMPESYFTGRKEEESAFKTATTETSSTLEKKGIDAVSFTNFWNFIVLCNDLVGFPVSLQDRRIFAPTVSEEMINDPKKAEYFNRLHEAIDYGNEVGEFLYFLLSHQIPEGWTPYGNLPRFTPTIWTAIRESPKSADLNWFLSKVEAGRWSFKTSTGSSFPIIQDSNSTDVPSALLWNAYKNEKCANKDHEKNSTIKNMAQLKAFFSDLLPKNLFDSKKIRMYGITEPVRGYIFGSMKDIEFHLKEKYKFNLGDDEEVEQIITTPQKKRKVGEHSEFDSMNVEDTCYDDDLPEIASPVIDEMFKKHDLTTKLLQQGISVIDNPGHGDCLPYSLIDYLRKVRGYNGNFQTLREEVAEFVFTNWNMLRNYPSMAMFADAGTVLKWIANVRKAGEWCGQEFAHVVACKYRFRLEIFALNNEGSVETHYFAPEGLEDQSETVRLAYVDQPGHYMSVWPNQL